MKTHPDAKGKESDSSSDSSSDSDADIMHKLSGKSDNKATATIKKKKMNK